MDYEFANDRFAQLQAKYNDLNQMYQKDKNFYEDALEARMNQLEEFELDNERLKGQLEDAKRNEQREKSKAS